MIIIKWAFLASGGLARAESLQMNGSVFSTGLWLEVINAFADKMTYYCDGYCMIMELSLCLSALVSLSTSKAENRKTTHLLKVEIVGSK